MTPLRLLVVSLALILSSPAHTDDGSPAPDFSTAEELLGVVSAAGDAVQQADDQLRALNDGMRANYARTLERVTAAIDPVLVVQFDGTGGVFHLRNDGQVTSVRPVPVTYELAKDVAHVPLDLYVILAPYLAAPELGLWREQLADAGDRIRTALHHLDSGSLEGSAREDARTVLTLSREFVQDTIARGDFTADDYTAYTASIFEAVGNLRAYATGVQMDAVVAQLEAWREELGPERWHEFSAVVIAPFTLSGENAVAQALRKVMDPQQVNRRLITVGGDYGNDVDVAISVMGRLFIDGLAARLVFDQDSQLGQEMTRSLSTSRDLMAVPASDHLEAMDEGTE